jgi:tetratricopeptide (TPR) repeat protein
MLNDKKSSSLEWYSGMGLLTLVIVTVMLAHGLTVIVPFHFDDVHQIKLNSALRNPASISSFFTNPYIGSSTGHGVFYRPFLFLTFLLDGLVGGGTPLPYRVTSLLMLVLYAFAVRYFSVLFLQRIKPSESFETIKKISSVAALLVVVHPIFNEAVLLATARSSTMMATFGLLALAKLLQSDEAKWNKLYAVLLTLAALLTKETGVVLAPLAVFLAIVCNYDKGLKGKLWTSWPIVLTVLVYVVFHGTVFQWMLKANPSTPFPTSLTDTISPFVYPAKGGMALLGFIRLFFFPVGLSLVHTLDVTKRVTLLLGYAIWPISVALGTAATCRCGKIRMAGIALLWFVIALAPSLILVRLNTPLAEHRAAIAVVMPLIALSCALHTISRERLKALALISLCFILGTASLVQTLPYRTAVDLWTHEVKLQPESARAWGFLADTLYEKGDYQGARQAILNALRLAPSRTSQCCTYWRHNVWQ